MKIQPGGGFQGSAYDFAMHQESNWPTEKEYPYLGIESFCANKNYSSAVKIIDYKYVVGQDSLMDALANVGPVTVSVSTFPSQGWTFYNGQTIYNDLLCNPLIPDHSVLAVGYDRSGPTPYWILKNQWSSFWGDKGYMKIAMNYDICGVASYGVLPIVQ